MITLVILCILSLILAWGALMYSVWKHKDEPVDPLTELTPLYNKSSRLVRKTWFSIQRALARLGDTITILATKLFFMLFPKARKAFEKKDELTGLQHGPSSYFLKSISPDKNESVESEPKIRRKRKNV